MTDAARPQHLVRALGLRILSDIDCAAFAPAPPGPHDATIRRAAPMDVVPPGLSVDFETGIHHLSWTGVGAFRIDGPERIVVTPQEGVPEAMLELPLIGPVMALLLHTRGAVVLHASAIEIDGGAVLLLGDKGAGKSTTAAALIAAGHRLLSDDVVVISGDCAGAPMVQPAFAQMKLSVPASRALSLDDTILRTIEGAGTISDKRVHGVAHAMAPEAVPLRAILVLERGDEAGLTPVPGPAAVAQLMRFSYAARFGPQALKGSAGAQHFLLRAGLADRLGVSRLTMPRGLERLPGAVAFLEAALDRGRVAAG